MIPHGLLFGLGLLSTDELGQIFPKWPPPENDMLLNIPRSFQCPSPTTSHIHPCFPRRSSKNCSQVRPRFLWRLCFALGASACESLCVPFKNGVSVSPSPVELLCTSPTGLQCQMLQGLFLPVPDPLTWEFDVGFRTLTHVGESL